MQDPNVVVTAGHLTRDPELRHTKSGIAVTTARIAVQRPSGREGEDRGAVFIDVEIWRGYAEAVCRFKKKGEYILIEGYFEMDEWEQDGNPRQKIYIVANRVHFGKGGSGRDAEADTADASETEATAATAGSEEEIPF